MVVRKVGTLQKMVEAVLAGEKDIKWSHVIHYLDSHSTGAVDDGEVVQLPFPSPLPSYYMPMEDLRKELWYDGTGDSILRICLRGGAPQKVVAAICQLCPEALAAADPRGRLPLHDACRVAPNERADSVLELLVKAYPAALLHRDDGGRTPLHWLFWYHAKKRSPEIVALFCQKLPKAKFYSLKQRHGKDKKYPLAEIPRPSAANKVPHNASIVQDSMHGCLPLHYAVMEGADPSAIQVLLQAYPMAKHVTDRYGRTPLHWYLGAGYLIPKATHVSGEAINAESITPCYDREVSMNVLRLLTSSRVARTADAMDRTPLHCACVLMAHSYYKGKKPGRALSLQATKFIVDHHVGQLTDRDVQGKTPVMVLLDTFAGLQEKDWEKRSDKERRTELDLVAGGPAAFDLPVELFQILLTNPDQTAQTLPVFVEDDSGRLPIHAALEVAASEEILRVLVEANPASLIHSTEETSMAPLHAAFSRELTAPLQTAKTIGLVLKSYTASRHGTFVDGRLAIKMEDAFGCFPIHYACENKACLDVVKLLVEKYTKTALSQKPNCDLPVQCLIDEVVIAAMMNVSRDDSQEAHDDLMKRVVSVTRQKIQVLIEPLLTDATKLQISSSKLGMLPLHIAVLFQAVSYPTLLRMLELHPQSALQFTDDPVHSFSALDLHELCKTVWQGTEEEWHQVRELLFSFSATLESHRHREELLKRCVRIVVGESTGTGSYHLGVAKELEQGTPDLEVTHTLSAMEAPKAKRKVSTRRKVPPVSRPNLPKPSSKPIEKKPLAPKNDSPRKRDESSKKTSSASIYDDEDTGLDYDVTSTGSYADEDDESYFSENQSEEGEEEEDYDDEEEEEEERGEEMFWAVGALDEVLDKALDGAFPQESIDQDTFSQDESTDNEYSAAGTFEESLASPTTTFEDGTTQGASSTFGSQAVSKTSGQTLDNIFEIAKRRAEEEKKEEDMNLSELKTPKTGNHRSHSEVFIRPSFLSEVGLRLWTFFVLYCDPNNPGDSYVSQVAEIFDDVGHSSVTKLVGLPLPPCASHYLKEGEDRHGFSFRDVASPKCRELIHKTCYFVGRYDFQVDSGDSLVHRSCGGSSVIVRANEWLFTTEEITDAVTPGVSEAEIWKSGSVPAQVGLTFKSSKRSVWIKFTKNKDAYENEVNCRVALGLPVNGEHQSSSNFVRMLSHYNANCHERKADRIYKVDIKDGRFSRLNLFDGFDDSSNKTVRLGEYPFALVYPASTYGTLCDFFRKYGVDSTRDIQKICGDVGRGLLIMHEKGVIHGNIAMENVLLAPATKEGESCRWSLADFSCGTRLRNKAPDYLGKIDSQGYPLFSTGTLPPEMFVQLSAIELKAYNNYWKAVEREFGITVEKSAIEPTFDSKTGKAFVVRCFFDHPKDSVLSSDECSLPPLPYELVEACESVDMWAFGQLLFTLCSGHQLFPASIRSGQLMDYGTVCNWDSEAAAEVVFGLVGDHLAQDLILRLLSPSSERQAMSLQSILEHPFFVGPEKSMALSQSIVEQRKNDAASHKRHLQSRFEEESEKAWLDSKTISIDCWDFELLERIHCSPTEIMKTMTDRKLKISIPCSMILLPYKRSLNRSSVLDWKAEQLGANLIGLSKACFFASRVQKAMNTSDQSWHKWASSEILAALDLSSTDFGDLQKDMSDLASKHVESFRNDPMKVAIMLVKQRIDRLVSTFDGEKIFLYLIDERACSPIREGGQSLSPIEVSQGSKDEILQRGILFMHLSCLYARGVSKSLAGLIGLLCEVANPSVPETWAAAAEGLNHELDVVAIANELHILLDALSGRNSPTNSFSKKHLASDFLSFMREFFLEMDPKRNLAGMRRVEASGACVWTTANGARELRKSTELFTFKDALRKKMDVQENKERL